MTFHLLGIFGNVIIPTDDLIFFRGVGFNRQPEMEMGPRDCGQFHMEDMEAAYFTYFLHMGPRDRGSGAQWFHVEFSCNQELNGG